MSETPRTDEQINGKPCTRFAVLVGDSLRDALVPAQFARELERENNRLRRALSVARQHIAAEFGFEDFRIEQVDQLANVRHEPRDE